MGQYAVSEDGVSAEDLAAIEIFANITDPVLSECAARAQLVTFRRGDVLAQQGALAEDFFVILDGSVEVLVERKGEPEEFVDVLRRGDCVGELALLLKQPRTATVRALRDCRAARISADDFDWLMRSPSEFAIEVARMVGGRLHRTTHRVTGRPVDQLVTVPLVNEALGQEFQRELESSLRRGQSEVGLDVCNLSSPATGPDFTVRFGAALQEADYALLVIDAQQPPDQRMLTYLLDILAPLRPLPRVALVILHQSPPPFHGTIRCLKDRRIDSWHHVELSNEGDFDRLTRRITGHATGLVLSGGGARGFAHIGVLRALAEANIPVDFIAGTSMGAIIGALHASGRSVDEMIEAVRRSYVEKKGPPDYAIPYVAIRTGSSTELKLKSMFGQTRIEDLRVSFFSVSASLNTAQSVVHETGRLWHAVRTSCSVPGLLPPIPFRGEYLVDGGLLDNLPVGAMRQRLVGQIIASDVSVAVDPLQRSACSWLNTRRPFGPSARMPGFGTILMRTAQLASVRDSRVSGVPADLYLNAPVADLGMGDFDRLDEIVERGAQYARKQLAGWVR